MSIICLCIHMYNNTRCASFIYFGITNKFSITII